MSTENIFGTQKQLFKTMHKNTKICQTKINFMRFKDRFNI